MRYTLLTLLLLALPATTFAQTALTLGAGGGYGEIDDEPEGYILLSGGFSHITSSFLITGDLEINAVASDQDRYYRDSSVDRCRDSETGRFAEDSKCAPFEPFFSGSIDGNYLFSRKTLFVGAGYKFAAGTTPYISGGYLSPSGFFQIKLQGWANFFSIGGRVAIPLG